MELVDQGQLAGMILSEGYVDVATMTPPTTPGIGYSYLLVMRFISLAPGHELRVRETQGAVVQRTTYEDQPGNGQVNDEIEYEETIAYGEDEITVAVTDTSGTSDAVGCFWFLYRDVLSPANAGGGTEILPAPGDDYYVRRIDLLMTMGTETFNAEIRLDPTADVADETVVGELLRKAGQQVDVIAMDVGLPLYTTGTAAGHYLDKDSADPREQIAFRAVRDAAAKYARTLARAMRPDRNDEPRATAVTILGAPSPAVGSSPSGGFAKMRNDALAEIRAALSALMYQRGLATAASDLGDGIVAVGWNTRCRPNARNVPRNVDPNILF